MSFGFSVGDVVTGASLSYRLLSTLRDSRGASLEYQEAIQELGSIQQIFIRVGQMRRSNVLAQSTIDAIAYIVSSSIDTIAKFLERTERYRQRLSGSGTTSTAANSWRNIGWTLFRSEELKELKDFLRVKMVDVNLLLSVAQHSSKLESFEMDPDDRPDETISDYWTSGDRPDETISEYWTSGDQPQSHRSSFDEDPMMSAPTPSEADSMEYWTDVESRGNAIPRPRGRFQQQAPVPHYAPHLVPAPYSEDDRIAKLEALLAAQLRMQEEKAEAKKRAAEQAARLEAEAKKKGEEDKLIKLEKLILAQKAEQIAREKAADAKAEAARKDADAKAAKEAAEKKAAEEEATRLVEAARLAREEAEAEAEKKAIIAEENFKRAIEEARRATEEAAVTQRKVEKRKFPLNLTLRTSKG